ncbi:VWA domain-containing protein [Legionella worsleiensis]|nr:VWA domain-containing protein [Legionella worsleiensis]
MSDLSNYLLRERSIKEFLGIMGFDLTQFRVSSVDDFFLFDLNDMELVDEFANKLNAIIKTHDENGFQSLKLIDLIDAEIAQATCTNDSMLETHRKSCRAILDIIKMQGAHFVFSQESGLLEMALPDPAYASMLNLLNYKQLSVSPEGTLVFDLKKYLHNTTAHMIKIIQDDPKESPLLFLNTNILQARQMYYATQKLDDGRVEVTPYFFVPHAITPPNYHFVLDVSVSMESALPDLKKSVKSLADQLFVFQPDAELTITTFSRGVKQIGVYKVGDLERLYRNVDDLVAETHTPLYEVTADFVERISNADNQNNVLLFTDGQDYGSKPDSDLRIQMLMRRLEGSSTLVARNKFNVISYRIGQDNLMHDVAQLFSSEVIETASADFVAAQSDPELLMRWAAARELFSIRAVVTDKIGEQTTKSYGLSLDMSGQLTRLDSIICEPGEQLDIVVSDSSGTLLLQDSQTFITQATAQETADDSSFLPKFFLDCADRLIEAARGYITDVAPTCPNYFPPKQPDYWQTNSQVFFGGGRSNGYCNSSLQIASSSVPQLGGGV